VEIIYWKSSISNFGDELNETFWEKSLGSAVCQARPNEAILGIGSILHFKINAAYEKINVLGTGISQARTPNFLNNNYQFWFVRGPLTANLFGLDKKLAISDPAVLIPDLYKMDLSEVQQGGIFIPHYASALSGGVEAACKLAGIRYISPMENLESIVYNISSARFVITESLHGAILADAYRIPWTPVASPFISKAAFKWHDWCQSLNLSYSPISLPPLTTNDISYSKLIKNSVKKNMANIGLGPERWLDKQTMISSSSEIEKYSKSILEAVNGPRQLSSSFVISEVKDRMYSVFEEFSRYAVKNTR
jgi:succinoglycan biosynthesis protein ExoV